MAIAQVGLHALADEPKVEFTAYPIELAEWQTIIERIENNPVVIVCGLERDPKRRWLRLLWKHKRHWQTVGAYAQYIQDNHPHMLPSNVQNVGEYMRCMLRGLLE